MKCRKRPPLTGSDRCYFDSPESEAEAEGRPIVTAEAKLTSRTNGGYLARRGFRSSEDVLEAVARRLDSFQQIGNIEAQLRQEIREKRWSYRDADLQVRLLFAATRRVAETKKLRNTRALLLRGTKRATPTVMIQVAPYARLAASVAAPVVAPNLPEPSSWSPS